MIVMFRVKPSLSKEIAHAAINRVASSYGLSGQAMLDRLIIAAGSNAIEVAKTLPNEQASRYANFMNLEADQTPISDCGSAPRPATAANCAAVG